MEAPQQTDIVDSYYSTYTFILLYKNIKWNKNVRYRWEMMFSYNQVGWNQNWFVYLLK